MAYATLAELKATIQISSVDATRDSVLTRLLSAAESAINGYCNRPDGFLAQTVFSARVYTGSGEGVQRIDECIDVSLVAVKESPEDAAYVAWAATDWLKFSGDPTMPDFNRTPYDHIMVAPGGDYTYFVSGSFSGIRGFSDQVITRGAPTVQVTAKWGYAGTPPAQVKEATVLQAARWFKRGESSWADTLTNADLGVLQFRQVLDPDLKAMLMEARLVRPSIGVDY